MKPVIINLAWDAVENYLHNNPRRATATATDYDNCMTWLDSQGIYYEYNGKPLNTTSMYMDSTAWLTILQLKYPNLIFALHNEQAN